MRAVKPLVLAGLAAVGVAGYAAFARAGTPDVQTMTVQLPGGGIEEIEYTGDAPPQVSLMPAVPAVSDEIANPFAALQQISAELDQQAAAMMNAMDAMAAGAMGQPGPLVPASFGPMPPGSTSYSFISSVSGGSGGACMQSLQITAMGNGQAPQVLSRTSGDCSDGQPALAAPALAAPALAAPGGAVPAALPAAPVPALAQPQLIRVRYIVPQTAPEPAHS